MPSNNTHVLIVGINSYRDGDVTDLRGARNDAIAWWRLCTQYLQVPAANITVLASPPLSEKELGPQARHARLGVPTRAAVVQALQQLSEAVADAKGSGLFTFSGHGVAAGPKRTGDEGEDLALCPQDVSFDNERVDNLLRFSRMADMFAAEACRDRVTVVLDTCYTRSEASSGPDRGLLGALRDRRAGQRLTDALAQTQAGKLLLAARSAKSMSTRLILGSEHWAPAHEIRVGNQWRGACSWALCTLMEQWARRRADDVVYLNVSYHHLVKRAAELLAALGVSQVPVLWGLRRLDNLPLLKPGLDYQPGETSYLPDGARGDKQIPIDVGHWVTAAFLTGDDGFAFVVATGDTAFTVTDAAGNAVTFAPQTEYWYENGSVDLSQMENWSHVSWRCHYSGSYETAGDKIIAALAAWDKPVSEHAWTASRTRYTWKAGAAQPGYPHSACFTGDSSGVVVGTDAQHRLTGLVIYNHDNGATWPDSGYTTEEGAEVSFEASSEEALPGYHYKFAT